MSDPFASFDSDPFASSSQPSLKSSPAFNPFDAVGQSSGAPPYQANPFGPAGGNSRAAQMAAQSQQLAQQQQQQQTGNGNGAIGSDFHSRDRQAGYSTAAHKYGGVSVGLPLTELMDARHKKEVGLSFDDLAHRGGMQTMGHVNTQTQAGTIASQQRSASVFVSSTNAANNPWNNLAQTQQQTHTQSQTQTHNNTAAAAFNPFSQPPPSYSTATNPSPFPATSSFSTSSSNNKAGATGSTASAAKPASSTNSNIFDGLIDFDPLSIESKPANTQPQTSTANTTTKSSTKDSKKGHKKKSKDSDSDSSDSSDSDSSDSSDSDSDEEKKKKAASRPRRLSAAEIKRQHELEEEEAAARARLAARKAALAQGKQAAPLGQVTHQGATSSSATTTTSSSSSSAPVASGKLVYSKDILARWGANPSENWAFSRTKTKTSLGFPKNCIYWKFVWDGERHEIEVFHSTVSGKRTIRCDGATVAQEKMFIDTGSRHEFTIGSSRQCQIIVLIVATAGEFAYELFLNKIRFHQAMQHWLLDLTQGK